MPNHCTARERASAPATDNTVTIAKTPEVAVFAASSVNHMTAAATTLSYSVASATATTIPSNDSNFSTSTLTTPSN